MLEAGVVHMKLKLSICRTDEQHCQVNIQMVFIHYIQFQSISFLQLVTWSHNRKTISQMN